MKSAQLAKGVVLEQVGSDLWVVVPGRLDVLRLTGEAALMLSKIQSGVGVDLTSPVARELISLGIVEIPGISRRGLIKAGAIGAGAGIAVMALPGIAAASSGGDGGPLLLTPNVSYDVWSTTTGVPVADGPERDVNILAVLVSIGGVPQGDVKADWVFNGATNWLNGDYGFAYDGSDDPSTFTEISITFEVDGATYEALYTAPI